MTEKWTLMAELSELKVLNHLDLLRRQVDVLREIGLGSDQSKDLRVKDRIVLREHQAATRNRGADDTDAAITRLVRNAVDVGLDLPESRFRGHLDQVFSAAHVEFHPTDLCNEACKGCTYGHDDPRYKPPPINFPFSELQRVTEMHPRAMTLAGGGEPLLYRDDSFRFADLVRQIHHVLPNCALGLVTNLTVYPEGDWHQHFRWIRASVDAASTDTYCQFRQRPFFPKVCRHILRLVRETDNCVIGVGFVFCRDNALDMPLAARYFYDLVRSSCAPALRRFYVAYRPLRRDTQKGHRAFPASVTSEQVDAVSAEFKRLSEEDMEFAHFVQNNTNFGTLLVGSQHSGAVFSRCGYSLVHRVVRANGDVWPCCMRINRKEFLLGNVLEDSSARIALNILHNAVYLRPGCDSVGCRLHRLNWVIEEGLNGSICRAADSTLVATNPFVG